VGPSQEKARYVIDQHDWRLAGGLEHLRGVTLFWRKWSQQKANWDHDHCEFCWAKFSDDSHGKHLKEGYTTEDKYYWICPTCYEDFKELLQFKESNSD
jgi:hypothetical protein